MARYSKPLPPLHGCDAKIATLKPLPGQRSLFSQTLPLELASAEAEAAGRDGMELFYTGRDLPGASEMDQLIIWDVP